MRLGDIAKLIRSKNAGPFLLTIDILFEDQEAYLKVIDSKSFSLKTICDIYQLEEGSIRLFTCDRINAIKISFNRLVSSGGLGDTDVFGGQQHGPLVDLEISNFETRD